MHFGLLKLLKQKVIVQCVTAFGVNFAFSLDLHKVSHLDERVRMEMENLFLIIYTMCILHTHLKGRP